MKKTSIFYAILFLLISPILTFAADITLEDTSVETNKSISVSVNTKEETVEAVKVAIQVPEDITISDVTQGDFECAMFSHTQNGSVLEITCTTGEGSMINSSIARVSFTTTSENYDFSILRDGSQIGELDIDEVTNIVADSIVDTTNDTIEEPTTTGTETPQVTSAPKEKGIKDYLPYVLLGLAGVFLLSIIILLVTKDREPKVSKETEAIPPVQTEQQGTDGTIAVAANLEEKKPTIQEMVNQEAAAIPTETVAPEACKAPTPTGDHAKDLEALIMCENPGGVQSNPIQQETNGVQTPAAEMANTQEQPYVANTSEGGLPSIGFTPPPTTETVEQAAPVDPLSGIYENSGSEEETADPYDFTAQANPTEVVATETPIVETPEETTEDIIIEPVTMVTEETPVVQALNETEITVNTFPETLGNTLSEEITPAVAPESLLSQEGIEVTPAPINLDAIPTTPIETPMPMSQEASDLQALVDNEVSHIPPQEPTIQEVVPPATTTPVPEATPTDVPMGI